MRIRKCLCESDPKVKVRKVAGWRRVVMVVTARLMGVHLGIVMVGKWHYHSSELLANFLLSSHSRHCSNFFLWGVSSLYERALFAR